MCEEKGENSRNAEALLLFFLLLYSCVAGTNTSVLMHAGNIQHPASLLAQQSNPSSHNGCLETCYGVAPPFSSYNSAPPPTHPLEK